MSAHLIGAPGGTGLVLVEYPDRLPAVAWVGVVDPALTAADVAALVPLPPQDGRDRFDPAMTSLLPEPARNFWGRPGLAGHRGDDRPGAWSTGFTTDALTASQQGATIEASDTEAGLALRTEIEATAGGLLRTRHTLTNTGAPGYVVDHLDVVVLLPDHVTEALDFTGRWARERTPQRHRITDGLWLREGRRGKTGFDAATVLVAGTDAFGFRHGEVWGVHVGWSGDTVHRLERVPLGKTSRTVTTLGGGELLLPGEIVLGTGESYTTPWVYLGAATDGLDALAGRFHAFERALPAHPSTDRPVTLNVWEAVYFDHDLPTLVDLAQRAARIGVERYVLDDGWFGGRRHDLAGLGDWTVSPDVWPDGLTPLVEAVHGLGLQFGLWIEAEMVNPDSDLYRAHPEGILASGGRLPHEERHQQVLDLTHPGAFEHVLESISTVLRDNDVDYVKWDHNRDIPEGGSSRVDGRPAVHEQTAAYYRLLDEFRRRFPEVEWESCASGGGRIDLGVLERVERVWTSDQNDALARQAIQRWTAQLVAPEYLGAHVAANTSHQTHRTLPLDFRAGTALFGHFGIEWDITAATEDELAQLGRWIELYKAQRALLHTGTVVRLDSADDDVWVHGVVAADRGTGVVAHVQLDELTHEPPAFRIPGLDPARRYRVTRVDPAPWPAWSPPEVDLSGAALTEVGLPGLPPAPLSVVVVRLDAV
ncbi:alpha-galactosidase [Jatrophihabitans sp. YIM 134969]